MTKKTKMIDFSIKFMSHESDAWKMAMGGRSFYSQASSIIQSHQQYSFGSIKLAGQQHTNTRLVSSKQDITALFLAAHHGKADLISRGEELPVIPKKQEQRDEQVNSKDVVRAPLKNEVGPGKEQKKWSGQAKEKLSNAANRIQWLQTRSQVGRGHQAAVSKIM